MAERRYGPAWGIRRLYPFDRRRDRRPLVLVAILTLLLMGVKVASMAVVAQPGYTDAYYFTHVASRVAQGQGLTADVVWNYMEAPRLIALPVPSHRFWMPLPTLVAAFGMSLGGSVVSDFRAGQVALLLVAAALPPLTYAAARGLGAGMLAALGAAAIVGLGGAFAPGWVSIDAFGIAAVLGTLFFLAYARAALGSARWGVVCGVLVGLLYLARAEAALFGLALVWLTGRRRTRRAGAAGAAVALAIGLAWMVRASLLGLPADLIPRAALLVRYEDFFALRPPMLAAFVSAGAEVLGAKAAALVTNAATAAVALLIVPLLPLALALRAGRARADVRAFAGIVALVYLVQSLVFTLHSTRGSFFHSTAAFFPFAVALAAAGTDELFRATTRAMRRVTWATAIAAFGAVTVFSLAQWDVDFNTPYRARVAALRALPPGPIVVADAAAWRWIGGRQAVLAPAEGPSAAACAGEVYLARTLVLEPAHFSRYAELYASAGDDRFTRRADLGGIRVYSLRGDERCVTAAAE